MMQIPDAPWVREAEMYGIGFRPVARCPICGEECDELFIQNGDAVGCELCIHITDAADWLAEHGEDER